MCPASSRLNKPAGVVRVAEHVGRRVVDRHRARPGCRVGPLAGVKRKRVELVEPVAAHGRCLPVGRGVWRNESVARTRVARCVAESRFEEVGLGIVEEWHECLNRGEVLLLDGGTGTELERRGVPMDSAAWCGTAALDHQDAIRDLHEEYIRCGADAIITNTFATHRPLLEAAGLGDQVGVIVRRAVEAALEARERAGCPGVLVAGSLSTMPASNVRGGLRTARRAVGGLPGAVPASGRSRCRCHRAGDDAGRRTRFARLRGGEGDRLAGVARRQRAQGLRYGRHHAVRLAERVVRGVARCADSAGVQR